MTKIILVLAIAYLLTGIRHILRDLRKPFGDRPAYARRFPSRGFLLPLFGWLPISVEGALRYRLWKEGISMWVFFVILAFGGIALL